MHQSFRVYQELPESQQNVEGIPRYPDTLRPVVDICVMSITLKLAILSELLRNGPD